MSGWVRVNSVLIFCFFVDGNIVEIFEFIFLILKFLVKIM